MFCVTRVCVSMYIYITSSLAVVVFCDDFLLLGEIHQEGRRARSLSLLSLKGCCFFDAKIVKRRKRETKGKKETKERRKGETRFDRVTVAEKV